MLLKKIFLVLIIVLAFGFLFGCYQPNAPKKEGVNCNGDINCIQQLSETCEKGYFNLVIPKEDSEIFVQFLGMDNGLCKTYVQAIRNPNLPEALKGLDMVCWFDLEKVRTRDFSINGVKCEGPLYEGLKAIGKAK